MQSPILVNRGWVPRSWREKSPESTEADFAANQSTKAESPSNEPKSWWKFWSKTPVITKVGLFITSLVQKLFSFVIRLASHIFDVVETVILWDASE